MKTKAKLVNRQSTVLLPERDIDKSPVLECVGLGVTFGGLKAVEDFDLTIGRTEIAGLIGPNGAGKTTVFNLLTKVYQPTAGAIVLDGKDTHSMTTAQVNRAGIARERAQSCWRATPSARPIWADKTKKYGKPPLARALFVRGNGGF